MRQIDRLCQKYSVANVIELEKLCSDTDQARMKSLVWDYEYDSFDTQIVNDLKRVPRAELTQDELWRVEQRIWMWYHHAVSCAIYRHKDKESALAFVLEALQYQARIENHPNKITLLFFLLLNERFQQAEDLLSQVHRDERSTARSIIREWMKKSPFA